MDAEAQLSAQIDAAFGGVERPVHFTTYTHRCECAEHDELLRARDRDTLSIADVGNPGWDPICLTSPQGIAYYFPALARLPLPRPAATVHEASRPEVDVEAPGWPDADSHLSPAKKWCSTALTAVVSRSRK
jgi:hypothetical protein